jgi:integrase
MPDSPNRVGQIGDYWLSRQARSPIWCRTWFDPQTRQTRRVSLSTRDLRQAQLALAKWVTDNVVEREAAPVDVMLAAVLIRFYEQHAKYLPSADQAKIALRLWNDFFDGASVADLQVGRQEAFVRHLRAEGHSDGYINRTMAVGRAALNRAHRRQEIASVPYIVSASPLPDAAPVEPKGRVLTLDEMARLFDAITETHLWAFCMIAANTLGRPRAIIELTREQYDPEHQLLHLNPPGRRQTKKFRPIVPVTQMLRSVIAKLPESGRLITYRGQPINSVRTAFRRLRIAAKLDDAVNPYSFRHTLARAMRRAKVPADQISVMLGHIPPQSSRTSMIYAPYEPDYARDAAAAIDSFMCRVMTSTVRKLSPPIKSAS